jgi:teichuronic acid exporter
MSIKTKAFSGLLWSFMDNFFTQGTIFFVGIILARLLSPKEFGLIGMTAIFIAVSQSIIDSGFTQALIRKKECTQSDYSTVFYFNLVIGLFLYLLLFFLSGAISRFFNEPQLDIILKVLGLGLIINAITIIQRARLTKQINFKLQTKISAIAGLVSGFLAIALAYKGFGVWSLVIKTLAMFTISSILLWVWGKWKPSFVFSLHSLGEMYSFGSKLLFSGLIETIYRNIYLLVIGKYFSTADLGFYTKADQIKRFPSQNITNVIQRVSYPILSTIQGDIHGLKSAYTRLIKSTMLITFIGMMGLAGISKPLIITLIGEQWLPSVAYLQLLCFVGMFYPLHAINLNILKVKGRSDLVLKLEIIKKMLAFPVIIVGIIYGIKIMIVGMIINTLIAYFLNSSYSGRLIGYSTFNQIRDILPAFIIAVIIGISVFISGTIFFIPIQFVLIIQITIGVFLTVVISEILQIESYVYLKKLILEKFCFKYAKKYKTT